MKYWVGAGDARTLGRTPQGVRGLKLVNMISLIILVQSHPARGAWIEMQSPMLAAASVPSSHPARGAWIEIERVSRLFLAGYVAPRKGCVD